MLFRSLLRHLTPWANPRPTTCRLSVETLEDRTTPSASFSIGDITIVEGNTGTLNVLVPVTLTGQHGNNVTVDYKTADGTADGSDYSAVTGRLTFNKNQTTKTIAIPIKGDRLVEVNETFSVQLASAKGANIADGLGVVAITDNEPRVRMSDSTALEGDSDTVTMNFNVTLPGAYDLPVTVNYTTNDGSATPGDDYAATSSTVTFQPGQTLQTIPITVNGDRLLETNETVQVNITTPNSYATITRGVGIGTIRDNEPHISIGDAVQDYYASSITFYVYLAVPYDQTVTVDFTTFDGWAYADVDYVYTSGTLTFNPGETVATITVPLLTFEPADKGFYVQLYNPSANATVDYGWAVGYWYYDGWWW